MNAKPIPHLPTPCVELESGMIREASTIDIEPDDIIDDSDALTLNACERTARIDLSRLARLSFVGDAKEAEVLDEAPTRRIDLSASEIPRAIRSSPPPSRSRARQHQAPNAMTAAELLRRVEASLPPLPRQRAASSRPPDLQRAATELPSSKPPDLQRTASALPQLRATSSKPPDLRRTASAPPHLHAASSRPPDLRRTASAPPHLHAVSSKPPDLRRTASAPPQLRASTSKPAPVRLATTEPPRSGAVVLRRRNQGRLLPALRGLALFGWGFVSASLLWQQLERHPTWRAELANAASTVWPEILKNQ